MSCTHCSASVPPVHTRSRFCVSCGRRLPPSAFAATRRARPVEEPAPGR